MVDTGSAAASAPPHWGPPLFACGCLGLVVATYLFAIRHKPTIFSRSPTPEPPSRWERASVYFLIYGLWAIGFGAVLWRGAPSDAIDPHFAFERKWPVLEATEWIYLTVYFVPLGLPWLALTHAALRRYAGDLLRLTFASVLLYLLFPFASEARDFSAQSLPGRILAWETQRAEFAAASLPSFHAFWALLGAELLASRGSAWRSGSFFWAGAVIFSCVANGAHALVDVAASGVIYGAMVFARRYRRGAILEWGASACYWKRAWPR